MVTQDMAHVLREVNINTNDIINRHDISQEANKLSLIVSELDGQGGLIGLCCTFPLP